MFQNLVFSVVVGALTILLVFYYVWFKKAKERGAYHYYHRCN